MAFYAIGDLHLSGAPPTKPMDVFGPQWKDHREKIIQHWKETIGTDDTIILCGDTSWSMDLSDAIEKDFSMLSALPGKKIILKGNHDYWWSTKSKMEQFFAKHGLDSLQILHNNSIAVGQAAVCGSRGWLFEQGEAHDQKIVAREAARLDASLSSAGKGLEKVAFLHYPPVFGEEITPEIIDVLRKHQVRRCYYGHIHGSGCRYALNGTYLGIEFRLISADFLGFCLMEIPEKPNKS